MDKTPPRGLDEKFVTLIHVILFLFPALWFGSRHLFPTWSLFLVLWQWVYRWEQVGHQDWH